MGNCINSASGENVNLWQACDLGGKCAGICNNDVNGSGKCVGIRMYSLSVGTILNRDPPA